MANHVSSKILLQQNKPSLGTPFSNIITTAPSQNIIPTEVVTTNGDFMRTFSNPTEEDLSPRSSTSQFFTPRRNIMSKTSGFNSSNHLEKFKLTTLKSKLKAFREADFTVKQDDEGKLASILKRSIPKTSKQSIGELSPLKPSLTVNEKQTVIDPFAETLQKFSTHFFPPHKSN